jgi:hypothetical protein
MADFLTTLAARTLGLAPVAVPVAIPLFAPEALPPAPPAAEETPGAPGASLEPPAPRPGAAPAPDPLLPTTGRAVSSGEPAPLLQPEETPGAPSKPADNRGSRAVEEGVAHRAPPGAESARDDALPLPRQDAVTRPNPTQPRAEALTTSAARTAPPAPSFASARPERPPAAASGSVALPPIEDATDERLLMPLYPAVPPAAAGHPLAASAGAPAAEARPATTTAPSRRPEHDATIAHTAAQPSRDERRETTASLAAASPRLEMRRAAPPPAPLEQPSTIEITIGRVEVRAVSPPAPRPPPETPAAPRLSLEEYLRSQNVRRR